MNSLKHFCSRSLTEVKNSTLGIILALALIGFADATYLTLEHFRGVIPPCSAVFGCEKVLTSSYSIIAGIPVSLLGMIYYAIVSIGIFLYLEKKINTKMTSVSDGVRLRLTLLFTTFGLLFSVWFIFTQAFILHAYCLYCLGSAVTSIIIFCLAIGVLKKHSIPSISNI